jgi:copper(I)-binding protein
MTKMYRFGGLLAAMLLSASVYAGDIQVEGAWARATAPGQDAGMADVTITSKQAATLVGVSSPVSKTAELHTMVHENGMMKMREVKSIELPAGKRVNLGEGGYHLMLIGLKAPLKAGESVPLTLNIKVANKKTVKVKTKAEVKPMVETKAAPPEDAHMQHMQH